ncbi:MAG: tetratricopeptide repeat protein [Thermodesulfobacteriota bacterium]
MILKGGEMASARKIIKKKLKEPDEFVTLTERAYLFINDHFKPIAGGGIAVLILVLLFLLFQRWERGNEENAFQMLNAAVETYQMVSSPYREGSAQEYKNVLEKFNEVATKFPRSLSGKLAILYQGNIDLRLGEFDQAIQAYESFLQKGGKEGLYRSFAMEGLGYSYEGKKDYEKAINAYRREVELDENFQLASAYLGLGRCYEKLGKTKEAVENYRSFMKVSQKSEMNNIVLGKISNLEKQL